MIAILLLFFVPRVVQAPAVKSPKHIAEDMEGALYDLPEFEDPRLLQYAAFGGYPVLSLVQFAKQEGQGMTAAQRAEAIKSNLEDVISQLQSIKQKVDKDVDSVHYDEVRKSVEGLKKVERMFQPDPHQAPPWMTRQTGFEPGESHPKSSDKHLKSYPSDSPRTVTTMSETYVREELIVDEDDDDPGFDETHVAVPFKWEVYRPANKKVDYSDDLFGKEWKWKSYNID